MSRLPRTPLNGNRLVTSIMEDEDFTDPEKGSPTDVKQLFAKTALTLVEIGTTDSDYRPQSVDQQEVAGKLVNFVEATRILEDESYTGPRGKYVRSAVEFNHSLKRLIDNDPSASYTEVLNFLKDIYSGLYDNPRDTEGKIACERFESAIDGIAIEVMVEQMTGYLELETQEATIEEDMKGVDIHIALDGWWYPVDVKAVRETAVNARNKHPENFIVSACLPSGTARTNGFRLNALDIKKYSKLFKQALQDEAARYNDYHRYE